LVVELGLIGVGPTFWGFLCEQVCYRLYPSAVIKLYVSEAQSKGPKAWLGYGATEKRGALAKYGTVNRQPTFEVEG
jgi:hypothetical protein